MNILKLSTPYTAAVSKAISHIQSAEQIRVLFVCLGNICRSPAADGLMHALVDEKNDAGRWFIDSAGTGGYHVGDLPDPRMRAHARHRGLQLTHICRQVKEGDFDDFDLIIGMDDSNISRLKRIAPTLEAETKILPMAAFFGSYSRHDYVPDPYYDGAEGFELVLDILTEATQNLYDTINESL